jgi:hypothetical protein
MKAEQLQIEDFWATSWRKQDTSRRQLSYNSTRNPRTAIRGDISSTPEVLAPVWVLLSQPIISLFDLIRPARGHIPTSPPGGLYGMPSLCFARGAVDTIRKVH